MQIPCLRGTAKRFKWISKAERQSLICPCCQKACGFHGYGSYDRYVIHGNGQKDEQELPRYRCFTERPGFKYTTFSLIECDWIPYLQSSISFLIVCLLELLRLSKKTMRARLESLLRPFTHSECIVQKEASYFQYMIRIAERSLRRMKIDHANMGDNLIQFLEFCQSYQGRAPNSGAGLNLATFESFGYFLFGTSSQHRRYSAFIKNSD